MDQRRVWTVFIFLILLWGCAQVQMYSSSPPFAEVKNDYFEARFEPRKADGKRYFNAFHLVLVNRTDKALTLDWSETFYLYNLSPNGRFGWEGMTFEQLKGIKGQPMVTIGPGDTYSGVVFPLKLIAWDVRWQENAPRKKSEDAFFRGVLPEGKNGIRLYVSQAGKVVREALTVNIEMATRNH